MDWLGSKAGFIQIDQDLSRAWHFHPFFAGVLFLFYFPFLFIKISNNPSKLHHKYCQIISVDFFVLFLRKLINLNFMLIFGS